MSKLQAYKDSLNKETTTDYEKVVKSIDKKLSRITEIEKELLDNVSTLEVIPVGAQIRKKYIDLGVSLTSEKEELESWEIGKKVVRPSTDIAEIKKTIFGNDPKIGDKRYSYQVTFYLVNESDNSSLQEELKKLVTKYPYLIGGDHFYPSQRGNEVAGIGNGVVQYGRSYDKNTKIWTDRPVAPVTTEEKTE
jgi:hypothetical protein